MKTVKRNRLDELYLQRDKINEEIHQLESLNKENFSKDEKIDLFRSLFICREDIFAKKWENKENKAHFFPVETFFKSGIYSPLSNKDIEDHLRGRTFLASYLINQDNFCRFFLLEISYDSKAALVTLLKKYDLNAYFEIDSQANLVMWIFLEEPVIVMGEQRY